MRNHSALLTAALLGLVGSAWAQSGDSTVGNAAQTTGTGLSRAAVLADLELWHRAGMTYWPAAPMDPDLQFMGDYQTALARYEQLRAGKASPQVVGKYQAMPVSGK